MNDTAEYDEREERRERERMWAEERAARQRFLTALLGAEEDRQAPPPVEDMDSLLGEHAAQLRNAARYLLGYAISDRSSIDDSARAATVVNNVIRTNIAIAKALREDAGQGRKTVRGVAVAAEPHD